MRLHSTTIGTGEDLLLLHGWGMNRAIWGGFPDMLAERFRVTLIELPGHGESEYDPANTSLEAWAEAVLAMAPERAVWIGWSLGAPIALHAALTKSERISALVALAGTPCFVQREAWPHAMPPETLEQFAAALGTDHRQTLERFLSLQVQGDSEARRMLRTLRQELFSRPEPNPKALENGLALLRDTDLCSQLERLACPTLWLLGERDTLVPAAMAGALRALQPGARIEVVPRAAHTPFLSHPEACLQRLHDFLQERA